MNVFILSDVEGLHGVTTAEVWDVSTEAYQESKKILTESINKIAQFCYEAGADQIYYLDGHGGMGQDNVIFEELLPQLIRVTNNDWSDIIVNKKVDCVIELGSHVRAGSFGFLDHTRDETIFAHRINGQEYGELALHAALCGAYGIPVVGCIGDKAACLQAREYIPQIHIAPVKEAISKRKAVSVDNPYEMIRDMVHKALADYQNIKPLEVICPVTVETTYCYTRMCEEALDRHGSSVIRKDGRTIYKVIDKITTYSDLLL